MAQQQNSFCYKQKKIYQNTEHYLNKDRRWQSYKRKIASKFKYSNKSVNHARQKCRMFIHRLKRILRTRESSFTDKYFNKYVPIPIIVEFYK